MLNYLICGSRRYMAVF